MTIVNSAFTKTDYEILNSYKILVEGLADYLGDGYEMVLHSLDSMENSVIKIINGHYTGRKEGSPITDLALTMLSKIEENPEANFISYFTKNKKGEPLKAATIVIRGQQNKIIGLLCMNFYLNTPFSKLIHNFIPSNDTLEKHVPENFTDNADDLIKQALQQVQQQVLNDSSISSANRNKEIVTILYQKGIFNLKDAVIKTSNLLGISKNTVYMHIRNISNK